MRGVHLPKRPPIPSESSSSSDVPEEKVEALTLQVGAKAELGSKDPGFLGSFYEVTITGHLASSGSYRVVYTTLVDDEGGPLEETVAAANVRPRPPPSARRDFAVHEAVEALHHEGWWAGVVSAVPRPGVYQVAFPTSREMMEFQEAALRPHRVFQPGRWVPAAEDDGSSSLFTEADELTMPVGREVEVRIRDPGFLGSFFGATITGHLASRSSYKVVYSTLVEGDGRPLEETVAAADVRPRPPTTKTRVFAVHEAVETLYNDGWWAGVISAVLPPVVGASRMYEVAFPSGERIEFEEAALRPHRVFRPGRWVPAAEVEYGTPLFPEGTKVEVGHSATSLGESWTPASVLKVIGCWNYLVQYTHAGNDDGELATEIVDAQYIRPALSARKYRFSLSCRVEVMHQGTWWPAVILELFGSKYALKRRRYETDMEDVEWPDVFTVENTQLRPQFRWDGKTWLRRLEMPKEVMGDLLKKLIAARSIHSETNTVNCDVGGSQDAVSPSFGNGRPAFGMLGDGNIQ